MAQAKFSIRILDCVEAKIPTGVAKQTVKVKTFQHKFLQVA